MILTAEEFEAEKRYQGLMSLVGSMVRDGLISETEYECIAAEYAARLSPITGTLLAENELLCIQTRVNMVTGKEADGFENTKD